MTMVPFMASASWYAEWLRGLSIGMPEAEAVGLANCAADVYGKDFARCRIRGNAGEILLSEAIEGGSPRLNRASALPKLMLSDHGNWRHVHIGALNAAYGRAPYFQHFMPLLNVVYNSEEKSLMRFNLMIHYAIRKMLFGDYDPLRLIKDVGASAMALRRGKEIASEMPMKISVIDSLMRLGRDTTLALVSDLNKDFQNEIFLNKDFQNEIFLNNDSLNNDSFLSF